MPTPTHGSWLNMVEGFFSKMTRQMLSGICVRSKEELKERILKYFEEINAVPVPYKWKYRLDTTMKRHAIVQDFGSGISRKYSFLSDRFLCSFCSSILYNCYVIFFNIYCQSNMKTRDLLSFLTIKSPRTEWSCPCQIYSK